jgi:hypothetical protein
MGTPTLADVTPGTRYTVTDSARVHTRFRLDTVHAGSIALAYNPTGAAPLVVLSRNLVPLTLTPLAPGSHGPQSLAAGGVTWSISWDVVDNSTATVPPPPPPTLRVVTISIQDPSFTAADAPWTLEVSGLPAGATVDLSDAGSVVIEQVEADPTISILTPNETGVELQDVQLRARARRTVLPAPGGGKCDNLTLVWGQTSGPSAVLNQPAQFPDPATPDCRRDATVTLPALNTGTQLQFTFTATSGSFSNSGTATINAGTRTRHTMLVLDRSGSMSGARWTNAVTAAHIWLDILVALRQGVNANDRAGILVFEASSYGFRADGDNSLDVDPLIQVVYPPGWPNAPLPTPASLNTAPALGPPGGYTPIGDALIRALDRLTGLPGAPDPKNNFYSIVLLTDGYENSGLTRVDLDPPPGPGVELFDNIKRNGARNIFNFGDDAGLTFPKNARLYPIGVGPGGVQEDVLSDFAYSGSPAAGGYYQLISNVAHLSASLAAMAADDFGGAIVTAVGAPAAADYGADPDASGASPSAPPGKAVYFATSSGERRLVVVMLRTGTQELALRWRTGMNQPFQTVPAAAIAVHQRPTHVVAVVDLTQSNLNATGTEWRVQRLSGGSPESIGPDQVIPAKDLHLRTRIEFDRERYRTGQPMRITAYVEAGGRPVTGATVRVGVLMPGQSQGTTLATGSSALPNGGAAYVAANALPTYYGTTTVTVPTTGVTADVPGAAGGRIDQLHPKPAMLRAILQAQGLAEFPMVTPATVFPDGTDLLHDDGAHGDGAANDGRYGNTFTRTNLDGTYTFTFTISGHAPDGSYFSDRVEQSRYVGIEVGPLATLVDVVYLRPREPRLLEARVFVTPRSRTGEYLGPFHATAIEYRTTAGRFDGGLVTHPDGRYSRRLVYRPGERPVVTVSVQGKSMGPAVVAPGCLAALLQLARQGAQRLLPFLRR